MLVKKGLWFLNALSTIIFWLRSSEMGSSRMSLALRKSCGKFLITFFFGERLNFAENLHYFFWAKIFFLLEEHLRVLSLASSISVLGLERVGPWRWPWPRIIFCVLGFGFFVCPWPRALCPQLDLWCLFTPTGIPLFLFLLFIHSLFLFFYPDLNTIWARGRVFHLTVTSDIEKAYLTFSCDSRLLKNVINKAIELNNGFNKQRVSKLESSSFMKFS